MLHFYSYASVIGSQATRQASTLKLEISSLFCFLVGHFCPPWIGIWKFGTTDPMEFGSNADPKHCFKPGSGRHKSNVK